MQLRAPYVPFLILIPLCLFLLLRLLSINENLLAYIPLGVSIVCLVIANLIHINIITNTAELSLISVKNSECIVVRNDTNGLICDLSDGTRAISEEALEILFDEFYCVDIDGYMLTHYHVRHISTIGRILRNHYLRTIILPEPVTTDEQGIARAITQLADMYGGTVKYYTIGEEFEIYGTQITSLKADHATSSHPTIAVRFNCQGSSIAYIGSGYTSSVSAADILSLAIDADTVILGAHGPSQQETEYFFLQNGQKIYISPNCTYQALEEKDIKLQEDENGVCKAFWKFEPQTIP